jgi:hypothetical protein
MSLDLRPLSLGELLDRSFSLYRAHFRTFVAIMAVPACLAAGFALLMELLQGTPLRPGRGVPPPSETLAIVSLAIAGVGILFYLAVHIVAVGATTSAVSDLYMGREATARHAYECVRDRMGRLLRVLLLTTLPIGAAFVVPLVLAAGITAVSAGRGASPATATIGVLLAVLLFLVGLVLTLFLTLRYSLAVPAAVIESVSAREAVRRSVRLIRGNLGRAFVVVLFGGVITQIGSLMFQGPFLVGAVVSGPGTAAMLSFKLLGALAGAVAGALTTPLVSVTLALLYYDTRVRHEGLDLQIMMDALDDPSATLTSPRPSAVL